MPKAGGKWNTFEITAKGRQITVVLNGQKTVELNNGLFVEGALALQHGARRDQVPQGGDQAAVANMQGMPVREQTGTPINLLDGASG